MSAVDDERDPQRDVTDERLRLEREKADAAMKASREGVESAADEVVRVARERADGVLQAARDDADRAGSPEAGASGEGAEPARTQADALLGAERAAEDAALERERARRRQYLGEFLAVEREATDEGLLGERARSDTVIGARDEFLATVSHDLRSLLGGLLLGAGTLHDRAPEGAAGEELRKHAATTRRLVTRMNRLVGDLLDITSIQAGRLAIRPEPLDVSGIVGETIDAFAPMASAKQLTLEADVAGLPARVELDGGRLLQVLANLVSNAIKFTPAGGRISIRVRCDGTAISFAVTDTGIGIAESALEEVFDRLHQVSSDRRGLGLGLHISRCIVEAHGGRMWAESTLGAGTAVRFELPTSSGPRDEPVGEVREGPNG